MGDVNKSAFYRDVARLGPWAQSTISGYVKGVRTVTPEVMEAMAEVLGLEAGAAYFREYRLWQILEVCESYPDASKPIYDVAMRVSLDRSGALPRVKAAE